MVYLIISDGITRNDRLWMNRNTIRLGRGTWLANGKPLGDGFIHFIQSAISLGGVMDKVEAECSRIASLIEGMIVRTTTSNMPKHTLALLASRLDLVTSVSRNMGTIELAESLKEIITEKRNKYIKPEPVGNKRKSLGISDGSAKDYILSLAKGRTVH